MKTYFIIIAIVILLGLVGVGIYFYQIKDKSEKINHNPCLLDNEVADYKIEQKGISLADMIVIVSDKNTKKEVASFEINNIFETSTSIELHRCGLYVIKMFNYDPRKAKQEVGYRDELWKYNYGGEGKSLILLAEKPREFISYYSPDFRVDPEEIYIVLEQGYLGKSNYALVVKNLVTKNDAFILPLQEIANKYPYALGSFNMREWTKNGQYFWGDVFVEANVLAFFRIERDAWKIDVFPVLQGTMGGTALNSELGYITYDDGPPWTGDLELDKIYKEQWGKEGRKVHFYLYNLFTKEQILLATIDDPLWSFKPEWLSDTEFEYYIPPGERKIYEIIQ